MSRVLLVAEAPRSIGEFRRRWVRTVHARYLTRYRRALAEVASRLMAAADVTVLGGREVLDGAALPPAVTRRMYDEELFRNDPGALARHTRELMADWWPERGDPALTFDGVWLPDLMPVTKGILLRLEVVEYVGIVARALDEVKPNEVVLLTGASTVERIAHALAGEHAITVRTARRSPASAALATAGRALRRREERRALAAHLHHRRRPVLVAPTQPFLFSVSHARHFMVVEPLVRALAGRGLGSAVIVATSDNREMDAPLARLTRNGVMGAHLMDYLPRDEARRLVRELAPVSRRLHARLRQRRRGPLAEVVAPYARDAVTRSLATARLYLAAARRALDALRPAGVVITSDRRMSERAFALVARVSGIPSVLFWGGALLGRDRTNLFDVGDRVLVIGQHAKTGLIEEGVEEYRLAAIGDPRSNDAQLVPRTQLRAEVERHFGLSPGRPLLVMVSKYVSLLFSAAEKGAFYRTVRDATRLLGHVNVIVKIHPNENVALLREHVASAGWSEAVITQDHDIHRLFRAADAAIMVTSMAGIEAMAMECPVVAVQAPGKDFEGVGMPAYVSEGAVERVDMGDTPGLATALRRLLEDPAARAALVERGRAFASRYLHPVDGAVADRLLDIVDAIRTERATART